MPTDAEFTLAFVAKRQGTDRMPASTWAHVMSLELGWMAPGAAKTFVTASQSSELLVDDDGELALGFDRRSVDVPRGFRPPASLVAEAPSSIPPTANEPKPSAATSEPSDDPFLDLLHLIASERSMEKAEVLAEVGAVQDRFGGRLSAEAAAVRVALDHGVTVDSFASDALARITSKSA